MRDFTPHPYQALMIEHAHSLDRAGLWAGMGMGKTLATLTALDTLARYDDRPTLVLAPLRVAESTWPSEAAKWRHLSSLRVVPVTGSVAARKAALRRKAEVYCTNYENIPWLIEQHGDDWPYATIVADESTRLKGFRLRQGGKRARALAQVAHAHVERFWELTGTPSPNGLEDLWGQLWFLDRGERLGRSFASFLDRWFDRRVQSGGFMHAVPRPYAQEQIQGQVRDICLSLEARDWFDLREPIVREVRVELPTKARAMYQALEREMFASLGEVEFEAVSAAALTNKCLQLANGAMYSADGAWHEVHDAKLRALESIMAEAAGTPVLVAYQYRSDLERILSAFPQARALDRDPQTIVQWNAGRIPMLVAHPASCGHGLNLQDGGNILAVFGHWWNLEEYQQIVERIGPTRQAQAGHDRPVWIYHIVAHDTVDDLVLLRRNSKREVQDLLLEAAKRRT